MIWVNTNLPGKAIPDLKYFRRKAHSKLDCRHTRFPFDPPSLQSLTNELQLDNRTAVVIRIETSHGCFSDERLAIAGKLLEDRVGKLRVVGKGVSN
jgi:hypothetical protein